MMCAWVFLSLPSDHTFKILLIGDAGVGKTSLLLQFTVSLNLYLQLYVGETSG